MDLSKMVLTKKDLIDVDLIEMDLIKMDLIKTKNFTEDRVKQAIRKNPWNIYYALDKFKNSFEIMKECVELEPNTYNMHLKFKK